MHLECWNSGSNPNSAIGSSASATSDREIRLNAKSEVRGTAFTEITGNKSRGEIQQSVTHWMQPSNPQSFGRASMAKSEEQKISEFGIRSRKLKRFRSKLAQDHKTAPPYNLGPEKDDHDW